jgi:DNA-directed RNA polymerase subunit F
MEEPQRKDFETIQQWMQARQKWMIEKNKALLENIEQDKPEVKKRTKGCDIVYGEPTDENDILLKFKRENYKNHECIYLSTFMKQYVNNICNIYITWEKNDPNKDISDVGYNSKPVYSQQEIAGIFLIASNCTRLNHLYWQVPFFGKCYLKMDSLLKILEKIKTRKKTYTINLMDISDMQPFSDQDNFRLGNLHGEFGIGQIHGQKDKIQVFMIQGKKVSCTSEISFIAFPKLLKDFDIQNYVRSKIMKFGIDNQGKQDEFLEESFFSKTELCPPTETILSFAFDNFNQEILEKGVQLEKNIMYVKNFTIQDKEKIAQLIEGLMNISENMPLENKQKIIRENQKKIQEVVDIINLTKSPNQSNSLRGIMMGRDLDSVEDSLPRFSSDQINSPTYSPRGNSLHLSDLNVSSSRDDIFPDSPDETPIMPLESVYDSPSNETLIDSDTQQDNFVYDSPEQNSTLSSNIINPPGPFITRNRGNNSINVSPVNLSGLFPELERTPGSSPIQSAGKKTKKNKKKVSHKKKRTHKKKKSHKKKRTHKKRITRKK